MARTNVREEVILSPTSWIGHFLECTATLPTPLIYRQWTALTTLSGALERRVWVNPSGYKPLYPNLYTLLVGFPASGKSVSISAGVQCWRAAEFFNVAPSDLTKAALIDTLVEGFRRGVNDRPDYHSLLIGATEFGVLLPTYDTAFIANACELYDCEDHFRSRTRGGGLIDIAGPHLTILAGCPPDYLSTTFPKEAWTQGFASRTIMVFSGERIRRKSLFTRYDAADSQPLKEVGMELKRYMHKDVYGELSFDPAAIARLDEWHDPDANDQNPKPSAPRAEGYNQRRALHCLKISMVLALAEGRMEIQEPDINKALELMERTERALEGMFRAMNMRGHIDASMEIYNELALRVARSKNTVLTKEQIMGVISTRVYPSLAEANFKSMLSSGMFRAASKVGPDHYRLGLIPDDRMAQAIERGIISMSEVERGMTQQEIEQRLIRGGME